MKNLIISKPSASEYAPYYGRYVSLVVGDDILRALGRQIEEAVELVAIIPEEKGTYRYAEGK